MKQLLLTILFTALTISTAQAQFAGGSGTEEDPYQVETVEQLQEIRNHTDNIKLHYLKL